ncbi:MAG: hypothetical protein ACLQVA_15670 [Candidatus Brocadiia bacterium]
MKSREYTKNDRDALVAVLRLNVPKYFSKKDVTDFQQHLCDRQWDGHIVFLGEEDRVIGCASYYRKSSTGIRLSWMFFAPNVVGHHRIVPAFQEYLRTICARLNVRCSSVTFSLNTTPLVARLMSKIGFAVLETVKDGYGRGYDKVCMEMRQRTRKFSDADVSGP